MSACPVCGVKGVHLGLLVPRDPAAQHTILHRCITPGCEMRTWEEKARHPIARILADWERVG